MPGIYLGADIGTTSAKCLAIDSDGTILALEQQPYSLAHPRQGWAEQDAQDYWEALAQVVRGCVRRVTDSGRQPGDIEALALSTQGDTLVMYDRAGNPLRPAISWMDCRATDLFKQKLTETDQRFWYQETGSRLTPYASACSLWWLAENEPETLERGCVGWVADYMAVRLTGRQAADTPSASWTPLFNPATRRWSPAVLEMLGIPETELPEVLESGESVGTLRPEVSEEFGLGDLRLAAGAFDQVAAAHGASAETGRRSVLSCGTAWVIYGVSGEPVSDPRLGIPACCHISADRWGMVLPFSGGTVYDWTLKTLGRERGGAVQSTNDPLIFIPHLYGGLCPDWREESRGTLLGLTLSHTADDIELAVMRGLAFESRRNMEAGSAIAPRPERIRMVGGATHSETWPQLIADVLAMPVEVWDCAESACYGAAKLAAGEAARDWTGGTTRVVEPRQGRIAPEAEAYQAYLRAYEKALELYSV